LAFVSLNLELESVNGFNVLYTGEEAYRLTGCQIWFMGNCILYKKDVDKIKMPHTMERSRVSQWATDWM